jgi:hypothetical protein
MPELQFQVESAECVDFAAVPMIAFKLRVENRTPNEAIHSIALRAQIQIESTQRRYSPSEQAKLVDLFGEPHRWAQTVRAMLWTHAEVTVPAFSDRITVDLRVPCTFDFNVAATKYFHGIADGEIPLAFLFSGSCFYVGPSDRLAVAPISWSSESRFRMPVKLWRETIRRFYPNAAWLQIRQDVFDRLCRYKSQAGIATWEEALERLLEPSRESAAAR